MLHDLRRASLLACVFLLSVPAIALAQFHAFQSFDVPGAVPGTTTPLAINDAGTIVGTYTDPGDNRTHGFRLAAGVLSRIDFPGVPATTTTGINKAGDIVGNYTGPGPCGTGPYGFLLSRGVFTTISFPGCRNTFVRGINNHGDIVGYYSAGADEHGFLLSNGSFTTLDVPLAFFTTTLSTISYHRTNPYGINDSKAIVGSYLNNNGHHGFLFTDSLYTSIDLPGHGCPFCGGNVAYQINNSGKILLSSTSVAAVSALFDGQQFRSIAFPEATMTRALGLNNLGCLAGIYTKSPTHQFGSHHGFTATDISVLDPVPDLLSGPELTADYDVLAKGGRQVRGVAADGVTQVVLRIPRCAFDAQFTVTVLNDQQPGARSSSHEEDGGLGAIGDSDVTRSQINVSAQDTQEGAYAFVVYRAPSEFARTNGAGFKSGSCGGAAAPDDQSGCRTVSIQIQNASGLNATIPIRILRPPVVLIHGLWSNWETWSDFAPLVTGLGTVDPRFSVGRLNYDVAVGPQLVTADPPLYADDLAKVRGGALGLDANAPAVMGQMQAWIEAFKTGNNPQGVAAAAVQTDVVGHSMGGLITRAMTYDKQFPTDGSFSRGLVHKLITINTPHRGSPLPILLLSQEMRDGCLRPLLNFAGRSVLRSVRMAGTGRQYSGAIQDLQGDDLSAALVGLRAPSPIPLTTAMIGGYAESFFYLDINPGALAIHHWDVCKNDPVAQALTSTGWPRIFRHELNDGIVAVPSQFDLQPAAPGALFPGFLHTSLGLLGFSGDNILGPTVVPQHVIFLLNRPQTDSTHFRKVPQ